MSLPIITLTSSSKTTISESYPSLISTKNLREPSFSSYLTGADETFVLKLRNTISTEEETKKEIDVFDAKRYFSDLISTKSLPNQIKLQKDEDPIETPISVYSESSSNIRGPLLHAVSRTSKKIKFLASIGCINCSCRDSNSVKIESVYKGGNRNSREDQVKKSAKSDEDGQYFSFPIFNPKSEQNGTKLNSNVLSVEKKSDMWSWEAISPGETTKNPSLFSNEIDNYDSDASSDLFEIKSIAPSANSSCYAPSEASSVEWSVVTESAADFSALQSDTESAPDDRKVGRNSENGKNHVPMKETVKRRCRILSGCKNEKTVGVAASVTPIITTRVHARNRQQNYDHACHVVSEPHRRSDERLLYT